MLIRFSSSRYIKFDDQSIINIFTDVLFYAYDVMLGSSLTTLFFDHSTEGHLSSAFESLPPPLLAPTPSLPCMPPSVIDIIFGHNSKNVYQLRGFCFWETLPAGRPYHHIQDWDVNSQWWLFTSPDTLRRGGVSQYCSRCDDVILLPSYILSLPKKGINGVPN